VHGLALTAQLPDAVSVHPRQSSPWSQSTPTSLALVNEPPGTPVIEPDVSSTMSMFGLWICRVMNVSGLTRANELPVDTRVAT
jgi:hypothetical protein